MKPISEITADEVVTVYSGKPGCGCGCRGEYHVNPAHKTLADKERGYDLDNASMRSVKTILRNVQRAFAENPEKVVAHEIEGRDVNVYAYETESRYNWVYALKPLKTELVFGGKENEIIDSFQDALRSFGLKLTAHPSFEGNSDYGFIVSNRELTKAELAAEVADVEQM